MSTLATFGPRMPADIARAARGRRTPSSRATGDRDLVVDVSVVRAMRPPPRAMASYGAVEVSMVESATSW
jgi:hypothetical protein